MFKATFALASMLCLIPGAATAFPLPDGPYDLGWNTIDGGGATVSSADGFTLGGTIGQPDAGTASDGLFTVSGGFWLGGRTCGSWCSTPGGVRWPCSWMG